MRKVTRTRRGDKVTQGPCGHTEGRGGEVWMLIPPCPLGPPSRNLHTGLIMSPCPAPDSELSKGGNALWLLCLSLATGKGQSCTRYIVRKPQAGHAWWAGVMGDRATEVARAPSRGSYNSRLRSWALSSRWQGPPEQASGLRAWWEAAAGQ